MVFEEIQHVLENNGDDYCDIISDITSRYPSISFKSVNSPELYQLHMTEEGKHLTNILLSVYSSKYPQVHKLAMLFKYWAKNGNLSNAAAGGMLPTCFPILVIYFCQQFQQIPVFTDAIHDGVTVDELESMVIEYNNHVDLNARINAFSLSTLWVLMLKFYSIEFNKEEVCVSILNEGKVAKATKMWQHIKRITIEEPGAPNRNLSLTVSNQRVLDFIHDKIRACYMYFGVPQLQGGNSHANGQLTRVNIRNRLEDFTFCFDSPKLCKEALPLFCRDCHEPGHSIDDCPDCELMRCQHLQVTTVEHRKMLSELLTEIKDQNKLADNDLQVRQQILEEIRQSVIKELPGIRLELYGSSVNGFGSSTSDMDICINIEGRPFEEVIGNETLVIIERALKRNGHFDDILRLDDAKVPLVKFYNTQHRLEGDLSLNNFLAQHNTRLLLRYSQIDERLRILGYCAKEFAKGCEMANAFQKTLSSYAYILMTIFYLQRCHPPVLPVLQELYEGEEKPTDRIVDDYNVWFFDQDNEELKRRWAGFGKNQQDVAELWVGFLNFYSQEFDIKTKVVSIKQSADMRKLERLWNGDKLAIQDPFNDGHNLGVGLSKKTNAYILNNLIAAREVFGTSIDGLPAGYKTEFSYFFENEKYSRTAPTSRPSTRR